MRVSVNVPAEAVCSVELIGSKTNYGVSLAKSSLRLIRTTRTICWISIFIIVMRQIDRAMSTGRQSIWRLVRCCAKELTERGQTPFTRGDLIKCVQRTNPHYEENSINPIIQGITDNLRGGAPGAVGKNILHSVDRGLFVLKESLPSKQKSVASSVKTRADRSTSAEHPTKGSGVFVDIKSYQFQQVCDIQPERNESGSVSETMPQDRHRNTQKLPLNKYGSGPFCKFKIPANYNCCGVYAIIVDGKIKYVGECEDLSS